MAPLTSDKARYRAALNPGHLSEGVLQSGKCAFVCIQVEYNPRSKRFYIFFD